jgi:hypothetical protein
MNTNKDNLSIDEPLPLHPGLLEIDQKSQSQARSLQVVDALSHMLIREAVGAFQSNQQLIFDSQVGVMFTDRVSFVHDGIGHL